MNDRTESTPKTSLITTSRSGGLSARSQCEIGRPPSAPGNEDEEMRLPFQATVMRAIEASRQLAKQQENRQIATPSSGLCKKPQMVPMTWDRFGQSMDVLANLKTSVTFSPDLLKAWYASLRDFSSDVFATAVVLVGMSDDKWPDVSTLRRECVDVARQKGYDVEKFTGVKAVSRESAEMIAKRMGLIE